MKESKTGKKTRLLNQRVRLLLIALAGFLVFLWLASASGPAYAAGGVGPQSLTPGEGGGSVPPSHTVEGWIFAYQTAQPVSGINVYLSWGAPPGRCGISDYTVTPVVTDSSGHFQFTSSYLIYNQYNSNGIEQYRTYYIGVNGYWEPLVGVGSLGNLCDNPIWCQWLGSVTTNSKGYAATTIFLDRSAIVNVPAAAMFSDTKYATLYYGIENTSSFSHTVTFQCPFVGITVSYTYSLSATYTFGCQPLTQFYVGRPFCFATFWDDCTTHGINATGISAVEPGWDWGTLPTTEYLNPNNLTGGSTDFPIAFGTLGEYHYAETGSCTWSSNGGVSFGISYSAFGFDIGLTTTVTTTSSQTNWVTYTVDRRGDNNTSPVLYFRAYTQGALLDTTTKTGGLELHVWDMSGAG